MLGDNFLNSNRKSFLAIRGYSSVGQIKNHRDNLVHLAKFTVDVSLFNPFSFACQLGNLHLFQLPVGLIFWAWLVLAIKLDLDGPDALVA